jgi:hypothetical protein
MLSCIPIPARFTSPLFVETPILISMLLEQQRQLDDLVDRFDHVEDDLNDRG